MLANALVMSHFDYCSSVWTNCNNTLLNSLQIYHNRLACILLSADVRTCINDIIDMMNSLNWVKLNKRWEKHLLVMLFKCPTQNASSYLSSHFTYVQSVHSHSTRRQTSKCHLIPPWNTVSGKRTIHYRACSIWNNLPFNVHSELLSMSLYSLNKCISDYIWFVFFSHSIYESKCISCNCLNHFCFTVCKFLIYHLMSLIV